MWAGGKWEDLLRSDPELDEEACEARREAKELHERANAAVRHADSLASHEACRALAEASAMYRRADERISAALSGRSPSEEERQRLLQCRLNVACLALRLEDWAAAGRACAQALELDAESVHAALFQSQLAARQGDGALAEKWRRRAGEWARRSGQEALLEAAAAPRAEEPPPQAEEPLRALPGLLQEGVRLLRQRRAGEALALLERVVGRLDQQGHGGPIERLASRGPRALAFGALEAQSEALAAEGRWEEATAAGLRALALLQPPSEPPFPEPEVHRRAGLVLLSLGHLAASAGGDPLPHWRRAAQCLRQHGGDPAAEGQALLDLGLHAARAAEASGGGAWDAELLEEAVGALGGGAERLCAARGRAQGERRGQLARRELRARAELVCLLSSAGGCSELDRAIEASSHLFADPPDGPAAEVREWAELCGRWAMAASRAGHGADAERALESQRRAGERVSCAEVQAEALQAQAVLCRRRGDAPGAEAAVAAAAALVPESQRSAEEARLRSLLLRVGPAGGPGPAAAPRPGDRVPAGAAPEPIRTRSDTVHVGSLDDSDSEGEGPGQPAARSRAAAASKPKQRVGRAPCAGLSGALLAGAVAAGALAVAARLVAGQLG